MEQVVPKTRAEAETQAEELTKKISSAVTSRAKREREIVRLPDYVAMVAEAKQIDQTADAGQMRLAQIAAQVQTKYGEETLKQFAKDTGIALCTLQRRRSVWRAWEKIQATPPKLYSVAEALQAHPDRANIIKREPNITTRDARKRMRKWKEEQQPKAAKGGWTEKEFQRWFNDWVERGSKAIEDGLALDKVKPEILKQSIDPTLLDTMLKGAETWIKMVNRLRPLFDKKAPPKGAT